MIYTVLLLKHRGAFYGIDKEQLKPLAAKALALPELYEDEEGRKEQLEQLRLEATKLIPKLVWLSDGIQPWDIFFHQKYLGNSRIAQCSSILKQKMSAKYVKKTYDPKKTLLYLGIDWTEEHRTSAPKRNWSPYPVEFPMCEEPYLTKIDFIKQLEELEIDVPELYSLGFSHNNCGGFCVRAGQGHFVNLLETKPQLFLYHEAKEQEIRKHIGKDVAMMRKQKNKVRFPYTLRMLREDYEKENEIDMEDIGGCGCFVNYDENDEIIEIDFGEDPENEEHCKLF